MRHSITEDPYVRRLVRVALAEDKVRWDHTSSCLFSKKDQAEAAIWAKQRLVVAGADIARTVFKSVDAKLAVTILCKDGEILKSGSAMMRIKGCRRSILRAERTALNFLQRMCGIATLTSAYVKALGRSKTKILDTRKTIPGWRMLDKYAVRAGGAVNHRQDLSDEILFKENHLKGKTLSEVFDQLECYLRRLRGKRKLIIVEATHPKMVLELIQYPVDVILFDNFTPKRIKNSILAIRQRAPHIQCEASGGITLKNIKSYAHLGLDRISIGALTHSATSADLSLII